MAILCSSRIFHRESDRSFQHCRSFWCRSQWNNISLLSPLKIHKTPSNQSSKCKFLFPINHHAIYGLNAPVVARLQDVHCYTWARAPTCSLKWEVLFALSIMCMNIVSLKKNVSEARHIFISHCNAGSRWGMSFLNFHKVHKVAICKTFHWEKV